jgi:hypothetical protein
MIRRDHRWLVIGGQPYRRAVNSDFKAKPATTARRAPHRAPPPYCPRPPPRVMRRLRGAAEPAAVPAPARRGGAVMGRGEPAQGDALRAARFRRTVPGPHCHPPRACGEAAEPAAVRACPVGRSGGGAGRAGTARAAPRRAPPRTIPGQHCHACRANPPPLLPEP